jgi:hypothetical protein
LPEEYIVLERKVDAIRGLLSSFLKAYGEDSIVPAAVQDAVSDLTKTLREGVSTAMPALGVTSPSTATAAEAPPKTTAHAVANACQLSHEAFGQDPLGIAVQKFAGVQNKVGDAELVYVRIR